MASFSSSNTNSPHAAVQDTSFTTILAQANGDGNANGQNYGAIIASSSLTEPLSASKPTSTSTRAIAPDLLRGLVLPLMSLDHAALFMGAWLHGTPKQTENASTPLHEWNFNAAYISRTLTHLCAPGFFFLMGMGVVYFHKSRAKLGWRTSRMVQHFVVRAIVLTLVSEVIGQTLMWKRRIWIINIVLIGLAVDYLISGLVVVFMDATEKSLACAIDKLKDSNRDQDARTPLLRDGRGEEEQRCSSNNDDYSTGERESVSDRAKSLSFWLHNLVLLALTYVTIWWNVWLDPTHGHCPSTTNTNINTTSSINLSQSAAKMPIELLALTSPSPTASATSTPASSHASHLGPWFDFWFYHLQNQYVMSGFPPLAWLSFCLFGLIYARIMLYKRWTPRAVVVTNLSVAIVLSCLFVATRLLHFGNLSEACLFMPEHQLRTNLGKNQYLVSIKSFFYVTKYPPSPSFFAFTMAANFTLLALFSAIPPNMAKQITLLRVLINFGSSALFFYVAHMYLYSVLSIPARYWFEHDLVDNPPNDWEATKGLGAKAPFWITWVLGLVILNPLCKFYAKFKNGKGTDSLWRFF
ncbi:uncharacterized protein MEPE_03311 [Melanopsichium pennsylvanicum]|uniref:Uncharacterized protein n=2 Tax=Melanopsichium pennsylvanicum TaxID=63383 RepID=A0AAJ5C5C9_9BASI|nr:conserved hypothetical protein [Melanopsichium pennsylvanicum 4]SNX84602.1 uncharacterized protein MEPE_03311 [Melanopsichium pennsylvanicum]